jgi:hypothetical protein
MSEDADADTVPRNNRLFNRVIAEISEDLIAKGFQVYDETAAGMAITEPGRIKRRDPELIDTARAMNRPPIDVILIFQIYASAKKSIYGDTMRPEVRVAGRLLSVRGNQALGFFEAGGDLELPVLPRNCYTPAPDRECLLERVGMEARSVAGAVGQALGEKLAAYLRPEIRADLDRADAGGPPVDHAPIVREAVGDPAACTSMAGSPYVLRFRNFDSREINRLEEYMSAFRCYEHHRPIRSDPAVTEYWYETRADQARLQRNLRIALEYLDVKGQVSSSGNTILIEKILVVPPRR